MERLDETSGNKIPSRRVFLRTAGLGLAATSFGVMGSTAGPVRAWAKGGSDSGSGSKDGGATTVAAGKSDVQ